MEFASYIKKQEELKRGEREVVRLNLRIKYNNFNQFGGQIPAVATLDRSFTQALLDEDKKYFMHVESIIMSGNLLPVGFMPIQVDQGNKNLSLYQVTLRYNNTNFQDTIIWAPEDLTINSARVKSPAANGGDQYLDEYYFIYSVQHLLDLINTSLQAAFTALTTAFPAVLVAPISITEAPFLVFDAESRLISIVVQQQYSQYISLFFNSNLYDILRTFKSTLVTGLYGAGADNLISLAYNGINAYNKIVPATAISTTYDYLRIVQSHSSLDSWFPEERFLITCGSIGLSPDRYPSNFSNGEFNTEYILGSFAHNAEKTQIMRRYHTHNPRIIELRDITNNDISKITLQVWWLVKGTGYKFPLKLSGGQSVDIVLAFVNRELIT